MKTLLRLLVLAVLNLGLLSQAQAMGIQKPKPKPSPPVPICNASSQPSPTWGVKGGQCLMSCGALGGTEIYADSCLNHGLIDLGISYDADNCCKPNVSSGNSKNVENLVVAGYQGWFGVKGDAGLDQWSHWSPGVSPAPGKINFEIYPDVRDYDPADLFETALGPLGNGQPSKLFSSASQSVIATHFRWMQDSGIDGISLQRFVSSLRSPPHHKFLNVVLGHVRAQAEATNKLFYVNYDISGANEETFINEIKNDWILSILSPHRGGLFESSPQLGDRK